MRLMIIAISIAMLAGCVTTQQANERIYAWKDVTLDDLITAWGVPKREQEIAGRKFYVWSDKDTSTSPAISVSTGSYGSRGGISIGTLFGGGSEDDFCSRVAEVDEVGKVKNIQWSGDASLCYDLTPEKASKSEAGSEDDS